MVRRIEVVEQLEKTQQSMIPLLLSLKGVLAGRSILIIIRLQGHTVSRAFWPSLAP
jgi:hypothetical protein